MTEMVFGTVAAKPGEPVLPRWWRTVDRWSMAAVVLLLMIGLLLALAASVPLAERLGRPQFYFVIRQGIFGAVAISVMIFLSIQSPAFVRRVAVIGLIVGVVTLTLLPIIGNDFGKGAVRWISLGFISLQPSEFVKPAFVVTIAWLIAASQDMNGPPGLTLSVLLMTVIAGLLVIQPDFGQAALIVASWCAVYFVAGASVPLILLVGGGALSASVVAYNNSEHVARRIDAFLAPDLDPTTQIGFATHAIREGGFFGVGVGEGTVKWRLPDAHTDFIVAVAVEEYGLVFCLVMIGLFLLITLRSLGRLMRERDTFARLAGSGLAVVFALQAFINISVAIRLLPAKGMTLPLVSYGGSSLLAAGVTLGALFALTRRRPQESLTDALVEGRA